jgi:diguanylate cyclase (GGDEF)-like protein
VNAAEVEPMIPSEHETGLRALLAASGDIAELLAQQAKSLAAHSEHGQADTLEALARADRTDDLTGLGNRRAGDYLLACLAPGDALVALDLDPFDAVNDTFGRACGDEVLRALGVFLLHETLGADTVARMNGQKFLLVLHGADAVNGDLAIERLICAWRATYPLATLSAGVAFHRREQTLASTYAFAGSALHAAKTIGRDRMILAANR